MERQKIYRRQAEAHVGATRQGHAVQPLDARSWADGLFALAAAAGGDILGIAAQEHAKNRQARLAQSLLEADAEFEGWKTGYMRDNQGQNALGAQRAFVEKHAEIALATLEKFGGEDESFRSELAAKLRLRSLHALQAGGAYQKQQEKAWQDSVFDSEKSAFLKTINENPDDYDWLRMRGKELLESWKIKNPGLDAGAIEDQILALIANGGKTGVS